jgi:hypothetical protein
LGILDMWLDLEYGILNEIEGFECSILVKTKVDIE